MLKQRDYTAVFDASPDAMLVVDADGVIQDLNRQAVAMFGWSREELEGSQVERLIPDGQSRSAPSASPTLRRVTEAAPDGRGT